MAMDQCLTLIRKQILEGTVWNHPSYEESIEGLAQALQGPDRAELVEAAAKLLKDPDIRVRSGIVRVVYHLASDLGAEWLTTSLEQNPELYVGVEPVDTRLNQPDLAKAMIIAISEFIQPGDKRSLALLRKTAQDPFWGIWVLPALARIDGEWLSENAEIVPHRMISVLSALNPEQREQMVRTLVPWPQATVAQIPADFWQQFPPQEAKILNQLMSGDDS